MEIKADDLKEVVEFFNRTIVVPKPCACGEMPFLNSALGCDPPIYFCWCECGKRLGDSHTRRDALLAWNLIADDRTEAPAE